MTTWRPTDGTPSCNLADSFDVALIGIFSGASPPPPNPRSYMWRLLIEGIFYRFIYSKVELWCKRFVSSCIIDRGPCLGIGSNAVVACTNGWRRIGGRMEIFDAEVLNIRDATSLSFNSSTPRKLLYVHLVRMR